MRNERADSKIKHHTRDLAKIIGFVYCIVCMLYTIHMFIMVRNRSITETQKILSIFPSKLLHGDPFGADNGHVCAAAYTGSYAKGWSSCEQRHLVEYVAIVIQ